VISIKASLQKFMALFSSAIHVLLDSERRSRGVLRLREAFARDGLRGTARALQNAGARLRGKAKSSQSYMDYLAAQQQPDNATHVRRDTRQATLRPGGVRAIVFYLPQFHPIPENDAAWGVGFTDWTNVAKALPQFENHYQPHLPADLGFYDLRLPEVQRRQQEIARQYGVHAFCYYYYWFAGRKVLETPLENVLRDPTLDMPFCICWANENWTRRWDGLESEVLLAQTYSDETTQQFIRDIEPILDDPRYLRVDGRPLLLIYRPGLIPNVADVVSSWRTHFEAAGKPVPLMAAVQSFDMVDPRPYGFDAAVEFPPHKFLFRKPPPALNDDVRSFNPGFQGRIASYEHMVGEAKTHAIEPFTLFRGAATSWDNEARKPGRGIIFAGSRPSTYAEWLGTSCSYMEETAPEDRRFVFINAWNEWAEGAHLEPDRRYGYAYLDATRKVIERFQPAPIQFQNGADFDHARRAETAVVLHLHYTETWGVISERLSRIPGAFDLYVTTAPDRESAVRELVLPRFPQARIIVYENRGRDMLPFLSVFARIADSGYRRILKVHSKRTVHRSDGDAWREGLLNALLSDAAGITRVFDALDRHPSMGVIAPAGHLLPLARYIGSNTSHVEKLARALGFDAALNPTSSEAPLFPAGSMYWFRPRALRPLVSVLPLTSEQFEAEANQEDGTLAHAVERVVPLAARYAGCEVISTDLVPALDSSDQLSERLSPHGRQTEGTWNYPFAGPTQPR
jgi:lipopolysaccharide biosynthesis protein